MFQSSRWTLFDSTAAIVTLVMFVRVFGEPPVRDVAPEVRQAEIMEAFEMPLAPPTELALVGANERWFTSLRCIAMVEAERRTICETGDWQACHAAGQRARAVEADLWPRGRPGQITLSVHQRIDQFAEIYRIFSKPRTVDEQRRAHRILARDRALCRRYEARIEALRPTPRISGPT